MKINVFKEEDAKDAVTYHSWKWDLTVYWHAGIKPSCHMPSGPYRVISVS